MGCIPTLMTRFQKYFLNKMTILKPPEFFQGEGCAQKVISIVNVPAKAKPTFRVWLYLNGASFMPLPSYTTCNNLVSTRIAEGCGIRVFREDFWRRDGDCSDLPLLPGLSSRTKSAEPWGERKLQRKDWRRSLNKVFCKILDVRVILHGCLADAGAPWRTPMVYPHR